MDAKPIWMKTRLGNVFGMTAGPSDGRIVLGIHGMSKKNSWKTWEPMMAPLASTGFRPILLDMPGWGKSRPPNGRLDAPGTIVAIMDYLCADDFVLMGKSWGGGVAISTALKQPDRVRTLILTAPAVGGSAGALENLSMPVLMAWSRDDRTIPFAHALPLTREIPNCRLETYDTGGHSAAQRNIEDFAPKAIDFLNENQ